ncbi:uncharacterized protein LOC117784504 [Drosophila innubila]|uniref:uncharacterized protein LOC117784504 n=1 Tax=Drosophila innubila TaxID=198719 RepID=UPI00148DB7D4|nr:uncharacterized protein LOC117784504 [Drosophila innubila]
MLTNITFISLLLLLWLVSSARGATVTWGQVNKYASTLHAQDVYLPRDNSTDADAEVVADVVYGLQNVDGYTITAVHAYDMTPLEEHGGDGGTAQLLSGGVGQRHTTVRFKRHSRVDQLPTVHFQLVIYGLNL